MKILLIGTLIIAIAMLFMLVKVLFRRGGEFSSQHIHDSKAMKERGIHCVLDQDREMRTKSSIMISTENIELQARINDSQKNKEELYGLINEKECI